MYLSGGVRWTIRPHLDNEKKMEKRRIAEEREEADRIRELEQQQAKAARGQSEQVPAKILPNGEVEGTSDAGGPADPW